MSRVVVIVDQPEGNKGAVVFASQDAANKWREVAEEKGIETYGSLRIVSRVEALLGEGQ